ncbi:MAG TPA: HepT-like ribonuclease domain-containing protein [Streptosporangiaceae bacterium]|nr:HepT-like ribonuclease domain-containing protein [Streptosporangiaceae bacterium]
MSVCRRLGRDRKDQALRPGRPGALRYRRTAAEYGASLDRDHRRSARGVSDEVRDPYPEVPWRVITDMRNRVSHGYFDLDVVWNTVTSDLPKLACSSVAER